jgi:hypothetical protein
LCPAVEASLQQLPGEAFVRRTSSDEPLDPDQATSRFSTAASSPRAVTGVARGTGSSQTRSSRHSLQRKPNDLPVVRCFRSRQVTLETVHLHPQRWHTSRDCPSSPWTPSQRFMTLAVSPPVLVTESFVSVTKPKSLTGKSPQWAAGQNPRAGEFVDRLIVRNTPKDGRGTSCPELRSLAIFRPDLTVARQRRLSIERHPSRHRRPGRRGCTDRPNS